MQYELELNSYNDIGRENKVKKNPWLRISLVRLFAIFIIGVSLGRVILLLNRADNKGIAPFGIAYLMALCAIKRDKKEMYSSINWCWSWIFIYVEFNK